MHFNIGTKILLATVAAVVITANIIGHFSFTRGKASLEKESFNKLTAVREMKAAQIEDYFQEITDQLVTFSIDRMIIDAMQDFNVHFKRMGEELGLTAEEASVHDAGLRSYYEDEFLERLAANRMTDVSVEPFWPQDEQCRLMQHLYIASNPNETGSKHRLDRAENRSRYSETHTMYHPIVREYLERFGYYDIFLVNLQGRIVYSVFKEVDFGTSLLTGPYKDSNFADAFRMALEADGTDFTHLVDFEPYAPSYDAPASFMASPIFDGTEKLGVLIFQMPVDRINKIMTNHEKWVDVGLGESGETYIIGGDLTMRNQSRFLIEDRENYLKMIGQVGLPKHTVEKISKLGTTIGLQKVNTTGTRAALAGKTATAIFPDYRNVRVLSAYKPLSIPGVHWAVMSEIDEEEAFREIHLLHRRIIFFMLVSLLVIIIVIYLFSTSITRPLLELTTYAQELSKHDFNQEDSFSFSGNIEPLNRRKDEIGELSTAFHTMQDELEQSVARLVESTVTRERMQSELEIGREIQTNLLPLLFPALPVYSEFSVCAQLKPAREVGGDWYDFFFIDDDKVCFSVGDVSGKGVPAALFMAVIKTLIKARILVDQSTASTLNYINHELSHENKTFMFATIFIGILDIRTGELLFTNAAHNPAFIKSKDGSLKRLDRRHGLVVGPLADSEYEEERTILDVNDILLLYTDGVTEAVNPQEEMFSEQRLTELFESTSYDSAQTVVENLVSDVKTFEEGSGQADDITVLTVQYFGAMDPEDKLELELQNDLQDIQRLNEEVSVYAGKHKLSNQHINTMHIVFEELLSNIIKYGFKDNGNGKIKVLVQISERHIMASISDNGPAFNPFTVPEPDTTLSLEDRDIGGLGIHIVRKSMDRVSYERIGNKNVVKISKQL